MQLRSLLVVAFALLAPAFTHAEIRTIKVTSIADVGSGTLRSCVEDNGPRVCIFEVAGRIRLQSPLDIYDSRLFVAGQTAPSPGVLISGAPIRIRAAGVTLEHLEVRIGDARRGPKAIDRDCVTVLPGTRQALLRHLSLSWAVDENFSATGKVVDVRVEDSIIAEALHASIHPEGPHSMAALVGNRARGVSFLGNLFAANHDRNVRWMPNTTGEMVGNVIYGWGGAASSNTTNLTNSNPAARPIALDIIGNVFLPGPSGQTQAFGVYAERVPSGTQVHLSDNIAPRSTNLLSANLSPVRVIGVTTPRQLASSTLDAVLSRAGSRPWDRNSEDKRIIAGVQQRSLGIRDRVGPWPRRMLVQRKIDAPARFGSEAALREWLAAFEA